MFNFTDDEKKEGVALVMRDPNRDNFKAACQLFPFDTAKACAFSDWLELPGESTSIQTLLTAEAEQDGHLLIPSKNEYLNALWKEANSNLHEGKDREKFFRQFGEGAGYIGKSAELAMTNNIQNNVQNNVMIVHSAADNDDDWEKQLLQNQERLINDD